MPSLKAFCILLRVPQWTKNSFVFLGVLYAGAFSYLPKALLAAFSFCLTASAIYIYNDLQDREKDRQHPIKYKRPLAAGTFSSHLALPLSLLLLLSGMVLASLCSKKLCLILFTYLLINIAYNHGLKERVVLDVLSIAAGFMLRVLAGTIGIGLALSAWLTLTATLLSLLIALGKRRLEKTLVLAEDARIVLKKYSFVFLDFWIKNIAFLCFASYFFYTLYLPKQNIYFLLTLPLVGLGLCRFVHLLFLKNNVDDPIFLFFNDKWSSLNLLGFSVLTFFALGQSHLS